MARILTVDAVVNIEDADAGRQRPAEERREADDADGRILPSAGQLDSAFRGASGLIMIMMQVPTYTEEHRKEQVADGVDVWLVFVRVRSLVVDPIQQDDDHEETRHANDAKQPVASEATETICDP